MKTSRQNLTLAREIFRFCLVNGIIDETKFEKFVGMIKSQPSSSARAILKALIKLLEQLEKDQSLQVESAFSLDAPTVEAITKRFETILGKKLKPTVSENKALIGGLRLKVGDNVWENTVLSNLEQLKGRFVNG